MNNKRHVYFLLTVLWFYWMWNMAFAGIRSTILPIIRNDLLLSAGTLGLMLSISGLGNALGRLICGFLYRWFGIKKTILLGIALSLLFIFLFSISNSYFSLLTYSFAAGIALGIYSPAAISLLVETFKNRSGFFVSLHETAAPLGIAAGPIYIGLMLNVNIDWGHSLQLWLIPGIILLFLVFIIVQEPQKHPALPPEVKTESVPISTVRLNSSQKANVPLWVLVLLVTASGGEMVVSGVLGLVLPLTMVDKFGLTVAQMGLITGTARIFAVVGQLGAGRLSDRFGRMPILVMIPLLSNIPIIALMLLNWGTPFYIALAFANILSNAYMPVFFVMAGELFPLETRGKMIGIIQFFAFAFSNIHPLVAGYLLQENGVKATYYYSIALLLLGATINLILFRLYFWKKKAITWNQVTQEKS